MNAVAISKVYRTAFEMVIKESHDNFCKRVYDWNEAHENKWKTIFEASYDNPLESANMVYDNLFGLGLDELSKSDKLDMLVNIYGILKDYRSVCVEENKILFISPTTKGLKLMAIDLFRKDENLQKVYFYDNESDYLYVLKTMDRYEYERIIDD